MEKEAMAIPIDFTREELHEVLNTVINCHNAECTRALEALVKAAYTLGVESWEETQRGR